MSNAAALHKEQGFPPSAPMEPERSAAKEGLARVMRFATHSEGKIVTQPMLVRCKRGKERGKRGRRRGNQPTLALGEQNSDMPRVPRPMDKLKSSKQRQPQFLDFPSGGKLGLWGVPNSQMIRRGQLEHGLTTVVSLMGLGEKVHLIGKMCAKHSLQWIQADFWELFHDPVKGQNSLKDLFEEVFQLLCRQTTVLVHCAAGIHRTGIFAYLMFRRSGMVKSEAKVALGALRACTLQYVGKANLADADRRFHGYLTDASAAVCGMGAGERVGELLHEQSVVARVFTLGHELIAALNPEDRAEKLSEMGPQQRLYALRALTASAQAATLNAMPMAAKMSTLILLSDEEIKEILAATTHGRGTVVMAMFNLSAEQARKTVAVLLSMPIFGRVQMLLSLSEEDLNLVLSKFPESEHILVKSALERADEEAQRAKEQTSVALDKTSKPSITKADEAAASKGSDVGDAAATLFRTLSGRTNLEVMRQRQKVRRRGSQVSVNDIPWGRPASPCAITAAVGMTLPEIENGLIPETFTSVRARVLSQAAINQAKVKQSLDTEKEIENMASQPNSPMLRPSHKIKAITSVLKLPLI